MDSKLETILDQAQRLPAAQRLQLIAALSERMARGAGIDGANQEFWQAKTLEEHVAEQGIVEPQSLARLHAADTWPEDEDLDEFLRDLESQRHPANGDRSS